MQPVREGAAGSHDTHRIHAQHPCQGAEKMPRGSGYEYVRTGANAHALLRRWFLAQVGVHGSCLVMSHLRKRLVKAHCF